jgi:hypothetical protein
MATTSTQQDRAFLSAMFPDNLLEEAIEFIKNSFKPEDIFEKEVLEEWAEDNEYIKNSDVWIVKNK